MRKEKEPIEVLRDNIYLVLFRKDWSIMHLAVVSELSKGTLQNILFNRKDSVTLSTICKLSKGTGIPVSELLSDNRKKKEKGKVSA